MTVEYNPKQSGNAAVDGPIVACSGATAAAQMRSRACYWNAPSGSELTFSITANNVVAVLGLESGRIAHPDEPGVVVWASGTWSIPINVTTGNMNIFTHEVHVCRVNAAGASQETLGSITGIDEQLTTAQVYTYNVSCSAATSPAITDRFYIVFVMHNHSTMSAQSLGITPDQTITTSIQAEPPRHRLETRVNVLLRR